MLYPTKGLSSTASKYSAIPCWSVVTLEGASTKNKGARKLHNAIRHMDTKGTKSSGKGCSATRVQQPPASRSIQKKRTEKN